MKVNSIIEMTEIVSLQDKVWESMAGKATGLEDDIWGLGGGL